MPGSSDKCSICSGIFFGRQTFLRCDVCRVRFHVACLKFSEAEIAIFNEKGYKCQTCSSKKRNNSDDTPVKNSRSSDELDIKEKIIENPVQNSLTADILESIKKITDVDEQSILGEDSDSDDEKASTTSEESSASPSNLVLQTLIEEGFHSVLSTLGNEFELLKKEMCVLREENKLLKLSVAELTKEVKASKETSDPPLLKCDNCVVAISKNSATNKRNKNLNTNRVNKSKDLGMNTAAEGLYPISGGSNPEKKSLLEKKPVLDLETSNSQESTAPPMISLENGLSESTWTKVVRRGRRSQPNRTTSKVVTRPSNIKKSKLAVVGSNVNMTNMACPKKKSMFISRFASSVKVADIEAILLPLNLKFSKCVRLKTRFEGYNSFFVEVCETDFFKAKDPSIWPQGVLLAPFYGKLKVDSMHIEEENVTPAEDGLLMKNH